MEYRSYTNGSMNLKCQTRNSALSAINWYRDGVLLDLSRDTMDVNVTSSNRRNSYYESTLSICDIPDAIVGEYTCEVNNALGNDSEAYAVQGKKVSPLIERVEAEAHRNSKS